MLARLRSAARDWERGGHAPGLLWSGEAAREARAWQQRNEGQIAPGEERYIAAVVAAAERSHRHRRQLFVGVLLAATAAAFVMGWLAWREGRAKQEATEAAANARQEALRARDATRIIAMQVLPADPTTQLALLREIEETTDPPPGVAREVKRLLHADVTRVILTGHAEVVWSASFSPDGQRIVSASKDKLIRVWNADGSGEPQILHGHDESVLSAAFSPDGTLIASASRDKTVRVWNADGSSPPLVLHGHDQSVASVSFSPDGQRIVSASRDKTVRVWSADGSSEPLERRSV